MRFPSMLRRLRNTQGGGARSAARSRSTPYTPYMPEPPVDPPPVDPPPVDPPPPVLDPRRPTVTIHVPRPEIITHEPFDVTVEFSESVNGFTQAELDVGGTSGANIMAWNPNNDARNFVATIRTSNPGPATFNVAENVAMNEFGFWNTAAAEVTREIPAETFTFTGIREGVAVPTWPYPKGTFIVTPHDSVPPAPPDYAVPIPTPIANPVPNLQVQSSRMLSDFEKHIAKFVFGESQSFTDHIFDTHHTIVYEPTLGIGKAMSHGAGRTSVSIAKFPYTPAFDGTTTLDDIPVADRCSPGVLQFVNSFAHEMAHWWQHHQERHKYIWRNGYRDNLDRYMFNESHLLANNFVDFEAHATAVGTYAVIAWQLEYRPIGQMINLTMSMHRGGDEDVGTVDRYTKIRAMDFQSSSRHHTTSPPVGTWITRGDAETLLQDFSALVTEIQTAAPVGG